ncbi:MAG: 3-phosphoshikimate 1-carboxyvinyltransferase [Muribaculaceae bacterium]
MSTYLLTAGTVPQKVEISLPLSKSISNRALLMNALSPCPADIEYAKCDDADSMLAALNSEDDYVNIGAAGTAMRFLTAYFATRQGHAVTLDGSERMRKRPISPLVNALRTLGAEIEYAGEEGFPPLRITGKKLVGGNVEINAGISSQFISALMMIGPTMSRPLTIKLFGKQISRPYIEMTASLMRRFGIAVEVKEAEINIGCGEYSIHDFKIEPDWSAATYWYETVAMTGAEIRLNALEKQSLQGDSQTAKLFSRFGIDTKFKCDNEYSGATVSPAQCDVNRAEIDLGSMPDTAQTFAVMLCLMGVPYTITGLSTLPNKETDRLAALRNELKKLGYIVTISGGDTLIWDGDTAEPTFEPIDTYKDHRMAMAFAPAVFKFKTLKINDIGVVSKSYPTFWDDLAKMGVTITEVE